MFYIFWIGSKKEPKEEEQYYQSHKRLNIAQIVFYISIVQSVYIFLQMEFKFLSRKIKKLKSR